MVVFQIEISSNMKRIFTMEKSHFILPIGIIKNSIHRSHATRFFSL